MIHSCICSGFTMLPDRVTSTKDILTYSLIDKFNHTYKEGRYFSSFRLKGMCDHMFSLPKHTEIHLSKVPETHRQGWVPFTTTCQRSTWRKRHLLKAVHIQWLSEGGRGLGLPLAVNEVHLDYKHPTCFKQNSTCQGKGQFILPDKSVAVIGINNQTTVFTSVISVERKNLVDHFVPLLSGA